MVEQPFRDRPRIERPHAALELHGRRVPIEHAVTFGDLRRKRCELRALRHRFRRAGQQAGQRHDERFGGQQRETIVQLAGGLMRADRRRVHEVHRSRVETVVHLHDADAGDRVAGQLRALYRRGATPARQ